MTFDLLWYGQTCVLVALAVLEEVAGHVLFYQVGELWTMGLLFSSNGRRPAELMPWHDSRLSVNFLVYTISPQF